MRRIYAAILRFDAKPATALSTARAHARRWVSRPCGWPPGRPADNGSYTRDDNSNVWWRTLDADAARLWELHVDEAFDNDPSMRQTTVLQIGDGGEGAFAHVQVSLRSTNGALTGAVVYENSTPAIVPTLISQVPTWDGGRRLTTDAWRVRPPEEERFAALVSAPARRLPVLLFVADAFFPQDQADEVGTTLAGLAHVAVVGRDRLDALVGSTGLTMPPGASVYLWWAADPRTPRRSPQWFRAEALTLSRSGTPAWPVIRTIYGAAAFRFGPPALAGRLEAEGTRRRIRDLEAGVASSRADAALLEAWERDLVKLERAQRRSADLEVENERIQNDLNALLADFKRAVAQSAQSLTGPADRESEAPGSLAEAVALAAERYKALVFLPEAFRSAEAWQYSRPEVVLRAFGTLESLAGAWRRGELKSALIVAAVAAGLPWRPAISQTARNQYRDDYLRRYRGRKVMLGPHLAWGNSPDNALRVYLHLDREDRTIVVGHAGRHLRDASNPHL